MRDECIAPHGPGSRLPCPGQRQPGSLFCRKHERAPAAQRGGWISAENRRRKMAGSSVQSLDASNIAPRLWVGGRPPFDRALPQFDMLVLCAQELQPEHLAFQGRVVRSPIPDGHLSNAELATALRASRAVAEAISSGDRALVTCAAGMNRSALVACLALAWVTRMSADELVRLVRSRRHPQALFNDHFCEILKNLVGAGRVLGAR